MTKINKFDKSTLRQLRQDIDGALSLIGKQYGITLQAGNATFTSETFTFKLNGAVIGSDGTVKTKERIDLEAFYPQYADKEIILSARKNLKGIVVGYSRRSNKYPFLVKSGKHTYKTSYSQVARALGETSFSENI